MIQNLTKSLFIVVVCAIAPQYLLADVPAAEEFRERVPYVEPTSERVAVIEDCNWGSRLSAGLPVHFFDEEGTEAMPGMYLDLYPCDSMYNFRVGVEGRHFDVDQPGAEQYSEFSGKATELTYIRVPISLEYVTPLANDTSIYWGLGPDLIRTANDVSDLTVGMHVSARLAYMIDSKISLALEGGYQWAEVSDGGPNLDLDGAYVTPTIGYSF